VGGVVGGASMSLYGSTGGRTEHVAAAADDSDPPAVGNYLLKVIPQELPLCVEVRTWNL
jgi:hypothetical protein